MGRRRALELVLLGILGRGHVLLEDVPGLGKTMMARCFSEALGPVVPQGPVHPGPAAGRPHRPVRLRPAAPGRFEFRPGPVFTQLLLADEINRTPPKTQAALLEAMAEEQVSSDGETRPLPAAVRGARHRQPDRVRGHLRVARGAAGPVPPAGVARLPVAATTSRSCWRAGCATAGRRRSSRRSSTPRPCWRCAPRLELVAGRDVRAALRRLAGAGQPHAPPGHRRREPARRSGPDRPGPRAGPARPPRLRHPRGRQGGGRARARPPDQPAAGAVGTPGHGGRRRHRPARRRSRYRAEHRARPDGVPAGLRPDPAPAPARARRRADRRRGRGHRAR